MRPFLLTTWSFGPVGADVAAPALLAGGSALDAVVTASTTIEDDPSIDSVGIGGLPDADGEVSLDGAVMTDPDRCGAVCYLRRYANAAAIARRVMEKTIHVTLCGEGAEAFADREGFERRVLLTDAARKVWETWRDDPRAIDRDRYHGWLPPVNVEELQGVEPSSGAARSAHDEPSSHDTVGVIAFDAAGKLAASCTTSGMAFKTPGRIGDSPIIGQGLYCDQQAGAAVATGTGELITGVCGSFLAVELMRAGATPQDAVRSTLERIVERCKLAQEHQVAMLAVNTKGQWSSGALRKGFHHTLTDQDGSRVQEPHFTLVS